MPWVSSGLKTSQNLNIYRDPGTVPRSLPCRTKQLEIGKIVQDLKAQTMTLCFDGLLTPGEAELVLKFGGCLNDKLAGLYRSKYTVGKHKQSYDLVILCVQLRSTCP